MYPCVHTSTVHNTQDVETTKCPSTDEWLRKMCTCTHTHTDTNTGTDTHRQTQTHRHTDTHTDTCTLEDGNNATCSNMDATGGCHAK